MRFRYYIAMTVCLGSGCYQSVWIGDGVSGADSGSMPDDHWPANPNDSEMDTSGPETICNGEDDNQNGIIDEVDVNGDGICDCLRIATVGIPGTHGENDVFADWLENRSQLTVDHLMDAPITDELVSGYHIIVVQDISVTNLTRDVDAESRVLERWINEEGGGLMTLSGYHGEATEIDLINGLLSTLGLRYGPEDVMGDNDNTSTPVVDWAAHPITEGITQIGMKFGRPVLGPGLTIATGRGVADDDIYDLGKVRELGRGKVFVWADEWVTYESEWITRTDYQTERFWLNTLRWLTPAGVCELTDMNSSATPILSGKWTSWKNWAVDDIDWNGRRGQWTALSSAQKELSNREHRATPNRVSPERPRLTPPVHPSPLVNPVQIVHLVHSAESLPSPARKKSAPQETFRDERPMEISKR